MLKSSESKRLTLNPKESRWSKRRRWLKPRPEKSLLLLPRLKLVPKELTERWCGRTTKSVVSALSEQREFSKEELRLKLLTRFPSTNPLLENIRTIKELTNLLSTDNKEPSSISKRRWVNVRWVHATRVELSKLRGHAKMS